MLTGLLSKDFTPEKKTVARGAKKTGGRGKKKVGLCCTSRILLIMVAFLQLCRSFSVITQKASSDSDSGSGSDKKGMDSDSEDEKPRPALSGSESQSGSKSESDSDPPPRKGPQARKNGLTSFHPLMIVYAVL